jgi:hypothetical protein
MMQEPTTAAKPSFDLTMIDDPGVRRALRAMHQQMTQMLEQQQMEIQALLEMMLEKHVGSIGEFRRQIQKLQSGAGRAARIHEQMAAAMQPATGSRPIAQ